MILTALPPPPLRCKISSPLSDCGRFPAIIVTCRISSLKKWNSHIKSPVRPPSRQSLKEWSLRLKMDGRLKGCILYAGLRMRLPRSNALVGGGGGGYRDQVVRGCSVGVCSSPFSPIYLSCLCYGPSINEGIKIHLHIQLQVTSLLSSNGNPERCGIMCTLLPSLLYKHTFPLEGHTEPASNSL
jgi:hypothetical protein